MEEPPKKFFRLAPGREVRLRYGFFITCVKVIRDETRGGIKELRCTYDPETRGGNAQDGRKVKATIHWVSAAHGVAAEVRLYNPLFTEDNPGAVKEGDFKEQLAADSLEILSGCRLEPSLARAEPGEIFQFERLGYFCVDRRESRPDKPVFNRTVTLRDIWTRIAKQAKQKK